MSKEEFREYAEKCKLSPDYHACLSSGGTFNSFLLAQYEAETGHKVFHTFNDWKAQGYRVKKGSSSYPIFSRPSKVIKAEKGQQIAEGERSYFYICHLFHDGQVEKMDGAPDPQAGADLIGFRYSTTDRSQETA